MIERLKQFLHGRRTAKPKLMTVAEAMQRDFPARIGGLSPLRGGDAVNIVKAPVDTDLPIAALRPATIDTTALLMRREHNGSICTINRMIHITLQHEQPGDLTHPMQACKACQIANEMLDQVRGNRDAATWHPTQRDVQLLYEAFRAWYIRTALSK